MVRYKSSDDIGGVVARLVGRKGSNMAYFLHVFSPITWQAFQESGATVTGFRTRHQRLANERVEKGDIFICYLTRLSRWCGALRVDSDVYLDDSHIHEDLNEFTIRFKVEPLVNLEAELAIPIFEEKIWDALTITNGHEIGGSSWTAFFRGSLGQFDDGDGEFLVNLLLKQADNPEKFPLTARDKRRLARIRKVPTLDGAVEVEVPEDEDDAEDIQEPHLDPDTASNQQKSTQVQATVARIGIEMGFRIWVPRNDKSRVKAFVPKKMHDEFLESLPLNYDDTTLRTVEQIDVLWLKGRSMARAFEIEHTTAVYSGLLRMADLLALQPNMDIRLHIVAPAEKREKVLREIRRPVFSLLERGPLYKQCSFLPYDAIDSLANEQHLAFLSDDIIQVYEETAEV